MKKNIKENVMEYATAFATASAGVLMLSLVPAALGLRQMQKAESFNKIADGHRMLSLAKTYDAKAAAKAIKEVKKKNIIKLPNKIESCTDSFFFVTRNLQGVL